MIHSRMWRNTWREAANKLQPASYWYLRGFDIVHLEQYVDWFNIMTYDIRK